jgi:hypothetical protein
LTSETASSIKDRFFVDVSQILRDAEYVSMALTFKSILIVPEKKDDVVSIVLSGSNRCAENGGSIEDVLAIISIRFNIETDGQLRKGIPYSLISARAIREFRGIIQCMASNPLDPSCVIIALVNTTSGCDCSVLSVDITSSLDGHLIMKECSKELFTLPESCISLKILAPLESGSSIPSVPQAAIVISLSSKHKLYCDETAS